MHSVFKLQHPLTFIANDPLPPPRPIYGAPHQRPNPQCADTATADNLRYKVRWRNDSRHDEPAKPIFVSTAAGATTSMRSAGPVLGKRKADASHEPPLPQLASTLPCTEFQSRADMYTELSGRVREFYQSCSNNNAVLSSAARPRYVDFHGSYSVVVDHGASHPKLVSLVSQDLQKIVKLPHRTDYSQRVNNHVDEYMITCHCDCRTGTAPALPSANSTPRISTTLVPATFPSSSPTPSPTPSSSSAAKKSAKQTSLSNWILRAAKNKEESNSTLGAPHTPMRSAPMVSEPPCGGVVRIAVTPDNSHPFFPGQKVVVEVLHANMPC